MLQQIYIFFSKACVKDILFSVRKKFAGSDEKI